MSSTGRCAEGSSCRCLTTHLAAQCCFTVRTCLDVLTSRGSSHILTVRYISCFHSIFLYFSLFSFFIWFFFFFFPRWILSFYLSVLIYSFLTHFLTFFIPIFIRTLLTCNSPRHMSHTKRKLFVLGSEFLRICC